MASAQSGSGRRRSRPCQLQDRGPPARRRAVEAPPLVPTWRPQQTHAEWLEKVTHMVCTPGVPWVLGAYGSKGSLGWGSRDGERTPPGVVTSRPKDSAKWRQSRAGPKQQARARRRWYSEVLCQVTRAASGCGGDGEGVGYSAKPPQIPSLWKEGALNPGILSREQPQTRTSSGQPGGSLGAEGGGRAGQELQGSPGIENLGPCHNGPRRRRQQICSCAQHRADKVQRAPGQPKSCREDAQLGGCGRDPGAEGRHTALG